MWGRSVKEKSKPAPARAAGEGSDSQVDDIASTQPFERDLLDEAPGVDAARTSGAPHVPRWGRGWGWISVGLAGVVFLLLYQGHSRWTSQPAGTAVAASEPARRASDAGNTSSAASAAEHGAAPAHAVDACVRFREGLPADYVVYASGAYAGRPLGYPAQPSGHEMTAFEVYVDEPERPVVLVLGADEPAIWNVRFAASTRIAGVIVSGHHEGTVNGLSADLPVLHTSSESSVSCGSFHLDGGHPRAADGLVRTLLGRAVDAVFIPINGRVDIGRNAALHSTAAASQPAPSNKRSLRPSFTEPTDAARLSTLINEGKLRRASVAELEAWLARYRAWHGGVPSGLMAGIARSNSFDIYMVLGRLELPAQLSGVHVFIVPSGLPAPSADVNSTVLSSDPPTCSGRLCDSR